MRALLRSACVGGILGIAAAVVPSAARAQEYFNPLSGLCELGPTCLGPIDCALTPATPVCTVVGDGGDPMRCRPATPFFQCCNSGMCIEGAPRFVLAAEGDTCLCVHPAIAECFVEGSSPPISSCLTNPVTMLPASSLPDGDCDLDGCVNGLDPDACDPMLGCPPPDGGPPDAGPRDMGPSDASSREGGPVEGGLAEGGPREGGPGDGAPPDMNRLDAAASLDSGGEEPDAASCPTVVLDAEDCGLDGHGNGCDDDANGAVDDGCTGLDVDAGDDEPDAGQDEEDAFVPPPGDSGGPPDEEDAGEEPTDDAGETPQMDAGGTDPATDGQVFRGSGGCGLCSSGSSERGRFDGLGAAVTLLLALGLRARRRRRRG